MQTLPKATGKPPVGERERERETETQREREKGFFSIKYSLSSYW
jgi:hypothetical protein